MTRPNIAQQWRTLVETRRDLIGGEIQHIEKSEGAFRGPIKMIEIQHNKLVITTRWTAHMPLDDNGMPVGEWAKATRPDSTRFVYDLVDGIMGPPKHIGDGQLQFVYPFSKVTIFPRGGSRLSPSRVKGL